MLQQQNHNPAMADLTPLRGTWMHAGSAMHARRTSPLDALKALRARELAATSNAARRGGRHAQ